MTPRVVHCKIEPYDVYIGRPSPFGNPFSHAPGPTLAQFRCVDRTEAISRYEEWLRKQPELMARVKRELRGKVLGCWCKPLACHGDVLLRIANAPLDAHQLNRTGPCSKCGRELDFYESKYIAKNPPHELVCVWNVDKVGCGMQSDPSNPDKPWTDDWLYYTDG